MRTPKTPFVTDEQIMEIVPYAYEKGKNFYAWCDGARNLRDKYEAELTRKDSEIEALRDPWISVKDRLPEEGQRVMTFSGDPQGMREPHRIITFGSIASGIPSEVTHWTPLPTPPQP
jgi:hypothetical protein